MNPRVWGAGDRRRRTSYPPGVVALVIQRQGGEFCVACGPGLQPPEPLEIDHKQPLSKGGDNHHLNLQLLCRSHNRGRGNRRNPPRTPKWAREHR